MKIMPIVLAFAAVGASAQTIYSGQADQERRERNREDALASYRAGNTTSTSAQVRQETHEAAEATRRGAHDVAEAIRDVAHKSAEAVRRAGHKTAEAARDVSDQATAKFGPPMNEGKANPDGINPRNVSSASPTAPSHGTTK